MHLDGELFVLFLLFGCVTGVVVVACARIRPAVPVVRAIVIAPTVVCAVGRAIVGFGLYFLDVRLRLVQSEEVLLEELEAGWAEALDVELFPGDLAGEELADLAQVQDGLGGRLGLAGALAPRKEFLLVARD